MIKTPPIEAKDTSDVFLIRHGFSEFNYRHLVLKKDVGQHHGPEYQSLKADPTLCDANLHAIGVHQCLENASHIADINITRVLVSPMRRALQTVIHMFSSHPNLSNIKFLVVPQAHEVMHTSNDVPIDVAEVIQTYAPGETICQGVKFDFSWLLHYGQPQLWSVMSLYNVEKQKFVLSKLKNNFSYEDLRDAWISSLMSFNQFETDEEIYHRGQAFKRFFRQYITSNPLPASEKLAIVCHSKFICSLTSSHIAGEGDQSEMVNFKWLNNCQTIAWNDY